MRNIPLILGTWGLVEQTLFANAFGFLLLALPREDSKLVSLVFVFHVYLLQPWTGEGYPKETGWWQVSPGLTLPTSLTV